MGDPVYPTLTGFSRYADDGEARSRPAPTAHPPAREDAALSHLFPAIAIFASGCLLIHVGRAYARATTVMLSATALMLSVALGTVLCQRIGGPGGPGAPSLASATGPSQ